jgi:F-box-like
MIQCRHCGLLPGDIVPGDSESNQGTSATTGDLQRELEQLSLQIAQVETLLKNLRSKAVVLKKRINQHSPPILKLPPEVTIEIFEGCLPKMTWFEFTADWYFFYETVPNATMPLVIGSVCSTWRNLALSTPKLWSRISLKLDGRNSDLDYEILDEWISRSGRSPLSIHLWIGKDETPADDILYMFADCCERWRDIYLALPLHLYDNFDLIHGNLPLLTTLCLDLRVGNAKGGLQQFSIAPRLCDVGLHGYHRGLIDIPFDHVKNLSLSEIDNSLCQEILSCSPVLSHLKMSHLRHQYRTLPPLVSHIKRLELSAGLGDNPSFLDSFSFPFLQELRICGLPHSSLISLVSRSGCSLQQFSLINCSFKASDLRAFFSAIPSLVELEVNNSAVSHGELFPLLDVSENVSAAVLPNLQVFKLRFMDWDDVNVSKLGSMVLSRWQNVMSSGNDGSGNGVARLSSVEVRRSSDYYYYNPPPVDNNREVPALLQQLIGEGLKISIRDGDSIIL